MAGSFYRVRCAECDAEQIVFDRVAVAVSCESCDAELATPTGGKATLNGDVVETVEAR